jgi:DNA-binding transcriptional regulator LsrR (DeoR family)
MTQSEIGKALGLSRVKIYRLLKQARQKQVVQIKINWPVERNTALEASLKQQFSLRDAFVLDSSAAVDAALLFTWLGRLSAHYIEYTLKDRMTLAVCMGRSTYETIQAISDDFQARVRVAQATGSIPFTTYALDSAALARQLAEKLGGEVNYLSSPLIADSVAAAAVLREQKDIQATLQAASRADVALVGIGNLSPEISSFSKTGFMSAEVLAALRDEGAVGDIAGRIITAAGEEHPTEYNRRIIGITLADLRQIPLVIAVAGGADKAEAILGALRTGAINVLCTDDAAARQILELGTE